MQGGWANSRLYNTTIMHTTMDDIEQYILTLILCLLSKVSKGNILGIIYSWPCVRYI